MGHWRQYIVRKHSPIIPETGTSERMTEEAICVSDRALLFAAESETYSLEIAQQTLWYGRTFSDVRNKHADSGHTHYGAVDNVSTYVYVFCIHVSNRYGANMRPADFRIKERTHRCQIRRLSKTLRYSSMKQTRRTRERIAGHYHM